MKKKQIERYLYIQPHKYRYPSRYKMYQVKIIRPRQKQILYRFTDQRCIYYVYLETHLPKYMHIHTYENIYLYIVYYTYIYIYIYIYENLHKYKNIQIYAYNSYIHIQT